jgi:hypothetical protein
MRVPRLIPCWAALLGFACWATGLTRLAHEVLEHDAGGGGHRHVARDVPVVAKVSAVSEWVADYGQCHHQHSHHHHRHAGRVAHDEADDGDHDPAERSSPDDRHDSHRGCAVCVAIAGLVAAGVQAPAHAAVDDACEPVVAGSQDAPAEAAFPPVPPARGPPAPHTHLS